MMRMMPWVWRKLAAVAHTLPVRRGADDRLPDPPRALRLDSNPGAGDERLEDADARCGKPRESLAGIIPGAHYRELAGQTHNVKPGVAHAGGGGVPRIMRYLIMHRTNPHYESGGLPDPDLIANVGSMIGEMVKRGVLQGAEGLRRSAEGVRLSFSEGERTVTPGPFHGGNELPAAFSIVRTGSIDEAIDFAGGLAHVLESDEVDIRPVTEPWDIGMAQRPSSLTTERYMVLHKATPATEAGAAPTAVAA